jgi:hypothetical protein
MDQYGTYTKNEPSEKSKRLEVIYRTISNLNALRGFDPFVHNNATGMFNYQSIINELRNLSLDISPYLDEDEKGKDKQFIEDIDTLCKEKPVIKYAWEESLSGRKQKKIVCPDNWEELRKKMYAFDKALRGWVSKHFQTTGYSETDEEDEEEEEESLVE